MNAIPFDVYVVVAAVFVLAGLVLGFMFLFTELLTWWERRKRK